MPGKYLKSLFAALLLSLPLYASASSDAPIVIVTSYNPDIRNMRENLTAFSDVFMSSGFTNPVSVENMNCLNLSESTKWKDRLWGLLAKYYENGGQPAAVILLGAEAGSAYLSLDLPEIKATPVLLGARGENIVLLPGSDFEPLSSWDPEDKDLSVDFPDYNIVSAFVYKYDVEKNIELVSHLDSKVDTLNFLTDNSFGGITMRSHLKKAMGRHPEYSFRFIDGRVMTFMDVNRTISSMSANNAILIGTWRIDKSDSYAMTNTTYTLAHSNDAVPAMTVSSVGLGNWAIGGYVPSYRTVGGDLAESLCEYLGNGVVHGVEILPSEYKFDYFKVEELGYDLKWLDEYSYLNKPDSFFKQHTLAIVIAGASFIFFFLLLTLAFAMYFLRRRRILHTKLENANRMKSDFIANISHEIRTPLNAVVGFSQMLSSSDIELSVEERSQFGEYILENSQLLLCLVNDILHLSTMDLESVKFDSERLDVVAVAEAAVNSATRDADSLVSINLEASEPEIFVNADKSRVHLVLSNILSNSKKFTKEGSITVGVKASDEPGFVEVSVRDTGCGIPEEMTDYIFERFTKLDSFKQGTGLGLAVVKASVEGMGGKVWLDTNYTEGAKIVFTLPAAE